MIIALLFTTCLLSY